MWGSCCRPRATASALSQRQPYSSRTRRVRHPPRTHAQTPRTGAHVARSSPSSMIVTCSAARLNGAAQEEGGVGAVLALEPSARQLASSATCTASRSSEYSLHFISSYSRVLYLWAGETRSNRARFSHGSTPRRVRRSVGAWGGEHWLRPFQASVRCGRCASPPEDARLCGPWPTAPTPASASASMGAPI